jgi:hypothetical protein
MSLSRTWIDHHVKATENQIEGQPRSDPHASDIYGIRLFVTAQQLVDRYLFEQRTNLPDVSL